jgi:hypothetical protein
MTGSGDPLRPFGTETSGHVWLHGTCWPGWHQLRRAEAIAALARHVGAHPRITQNRHCPAPTFAINFRNITAFHNTEMSMFPDGRFSDLTDSASQALKHLREVGLANPLKP